MSGQFHWHPETYLETDPGRGPPLRRAPGGGGRGDPFPPERVLELGIGTGETTRAAARAPTPTPGSIGLDSSPEMVFRARETYDDVQLARMEDPLPDGPWDLVISVLSVHHLDRRAEAGPRSAACASSRAPW